MTPTNQEPTCNQPIAECVRLLTRLDENMRRLVGNGHPGIISDHETRIRRVERSIFLAVGGGTVVGFLIHIAITVFEHSAKP